MSGYGHLDGGFYERRGGGGGKKLLWGLVAVALVVIVVVAVSVTVAVHRHHSSGEGDNQGVVSAKSPTKQAIDTICSPVDYKDACVGALSSAMQGNSSAGPKDLVKAAVQVTIQEVAKAFNHTSGIADGADGKHDDMTKQALQNCKELLQYAVDELRDTFDDVSVNDLKNLPDRSDDIRNWLSAVISYQATCLDGFNNSDVKTAMMTGLSNATMLTSNALAIVAELSTILSTFQIPFKTRRLLSEEEQVRQLEEEGFPGWFPAADRKLMALQDNGRVKPNVVVAKDGSGQFKTINDALNAMPGTYTGRYVIYIKTGVYNEQVTVTKKMPNVFMYGDGPRKTIITGNKNFVDGVQTFKTASFVALGDGFIAKSMGFQNTAGPEKHQAVAARIQSDRSVFFNCRFDGFQDTLYAQTHRQFYRNCVISGTIDFIFGDSAVVIQNCLIILRKPLDNQQNTVTAHGRVDKHETTGIIIHNCRIVPDAQLFPVRFKLPSYLGRPWKEYSMTVVMESTLGDVIQPAGWMAWNGDFALNTLYYAEYGNRGPGARTTGRVSWRGFHLINKAQAQAYTVSNFIQGNDWLPATGVPHLLGLRY